MTVTTVEEKQEDLDTLWAAFKKHVVSSSELEEELDTDLAQCRELSPRPSLRPKFTAV